MNNWKVIPTIVLATVLIFGAGVGTGGVLVNYVKQNRPRMAAKHPAPTPPSNTAPTNSPVGTSRGGPNPPPILSREFKFLQQLEGELELTKDQHEAIQKIITDNQNLVHKVVQDARLEIREALTPGQRQQFDELVKRPFRRPFLMTNAPPVVPEAVSTNTP